MNAIIFVTKTKRIFKFIKDCVQKDNNFKGSNCKIAGVNLKVFSVKWTDEELVENEDGTYDKISVEVISNNNNRKINKPTMQEVVEAVGIRQLLDKLSYKGLDTYIENNVTDLESAKSFLKKLSKVVLAIIKLNDEKS